MLRGRHRYPPAELADLLERYAVESYTIADSAAAVAAQREAVSLRRSLGDILALGSDLCWLSRIHSWAGDADQAQEAAREAVAVLEHAGDDRLLALAVSNTAQLRMLGDRYTEAVEHGGRAITLARKADDPAILSHALNNVGTARWRGGDPGGRVQLEESLEVALAAGEVEHACRAYANLIWNLCSTTSGMPRPTGSCPRRWTWPTVPNTSASSTTCMSNWPCGGSRRPTGTTPRSTPSSACTTSCRPAVPR